MRSFFAAFFDEVLSDYQTVSKEMTALGMDFWHGDDGDWTVKAKVEYKRFQTWRDAGGARTARMPTVEEWIAF